MSNIPVTPDRTPPDLEAEEVAAKHDIPTEEAKARVAQGGHERSAVDGAAEAGKGESSND
ncbi:hypothetical protein [Aureimonas jatrophae]|uniref:Uncharacterized protein n=1 Tax=Aureimonas jatrophae TaxID=1166073 RepID=A0A1H0HPR5_9HYPH|nr:hypothetical protein [Aureimonas jatrophae]MBB3950703.1 hypothetical protein [Aureimonas jatrophae]SDO21108.1 hypothetical protein SAMN05192530_104211 [Aureimonas jatrophae]